MPSAKNHVWSQFLITFPIRSHIAHGKKFQTDLLLRRGCLAVLGSPAFFWQLAGRKSAPGAGGAQSPVEEPEAAQQQPALASLAAGKQAGREPARLLSIRHLAELTHTHRILTTSPFLMAAFSLCSRPGSVVPQG